MNIEKLPHELALQYFTAILTKDSVALRKVFGWSDDQTKNIDAELQNFAASKLASAGNIITRKQPQTTVTKPEAPPVQPKATFQTFARVTK
jgi:hypothetical protein